MTTEHHTRKEIIDQHLKAAGWNVNDRTQVVEEFDIILENFIDPVSPYKGHQFSDYVLLGKDGRPLAVIEAKKTSKDANLGKEQAKQYCHNIQATKGGELPFCFYTNGLEIYFWDLGLFPPFKVYGFPTRDDLERYAYLRRTRKTLAGEFINTRIAGRDYQIRAIRAVMEAIEARKRRFLLVMATGTGKTRTCIALVDALMRAGWIERVLFLVDRIALRDQTLEAFKEHLPNEPRWPERDEQKIATDRRIYVSTYPTMLNIIRADASLNPHFFDMIVVDESHRSIYNTYQEILDYFHAMTLGLTATPTDVIDHNTFELFTCEDGVPTYAFSYEEAVTHTPPYLCNFQVLKIRTHFQEEGMNERTISLEDQQKLIHEGKDIEEIDYEGSDLERKVINRGTNAMIIREFMEECIKDGNGVLPGKTIFFCISMGHARRMEEIFNSLYPEYRGEIARVLVSDDPRVYGKGGLLDQFVHNDMPRIAISVDMLDTGIDVRELVNLVFAKPVFSYTKFWQMIGRGTRLLESDKLKPWCTTKDNFLIMDCWDNFEYFKVNPRGKELPPQIPLPVRLFGLRLQKIGEAISRQRNDIVDREVVKLRRQIDALPAKSVIILDAMTDLQRLSGANFWINLTEEKISYLNESIKPLFRTVVDNDFKAMRFEKDIVEVSLALLTNDTDKFETIKDSIISEIAELPLAINIVAREADLIHRSQITVYWAGIEENNFDELIEKIAPLVKYIEPLVSPMPRFNLRDVLVEKEYIEFGPQHEALSTVRYRELVEQRINELVSGNPVLQKMKLGVKISAPEIDQLSRELYNDHPHITLELLRKVYDNRRAELVQFIRHILGIEQLVSFGETVSSAFDAFLVKHTYLSSRQLQFLELLRNFVLERGEVTKRNLIESPFTLIHPNGIIGIFSHQEIDEILEMTNKVIAA